MNQRTAIEIPLAELRKARLTVHFATMIASFGDPPPPEISENFEATRTRLPSLERAFRSAARQAGLSRREISDLIDSDGYSERDALVDGEILRAVVEAGIEKEHRELLGEEPNDDDLNDLISQIGLIEAAESTRPRSALARAADVVVVAVQATWWIITDKIREWRSGHGRAPSAH
ncbi:hypothetical protein [Sinomonas sp. P10A9]|uniref:Uncharacterized protein n=1 Tax=Sinomonas puerhi TaxID=3238584 RepID=A0AB39L1D6_9MICC